MHPLDLNLATRPFHNNSLYWLGYSLAAVLLLLGTFWNASAYVGHARLVNDLESSAVGIQDRVSDLRARDNRAEQGIASHDLDDLRLQTAKAQDVIETKAFSWTRLFNQVEGVLPYDVRMVSVRPRFRFGRGGGSDDDRVPEGAVPIAVEGIARQLKAILDFERNLIADVHFSQVEPDRHTVDAEGVEWIFTMRFFYFPDGEPEALAEQAAAEQAAAEEARLAEEAAAAAAEAEAETTDEAGSASTPGDFEAPADNEGEPARPDDEPPAEEVEPTETTDDDGGLPS